MNKLNISLVNGISSYYVDSNGVKHKFSILDTPINNFCTLNNQVTINNVTLNKSDIVELYFLESYLSVTYIRSYFVSGFINLKKLSLRSLFNVRRVGVYFLNNNIIEELDLTPLARLIYADSLFLMNQKGLKLLDLTPLSLLASLSITRMKIFERDFLLNSSLLESVKMPVFSTVRTMGSNFMAGCSSLKELSLSFIPNATVLGLTFLAGCSSLTKLEITLVNLTAIRNFFCGDCTSLTEIIFPVFSNRVAILIQDEFLLGCSSLSHIDLSNFAYVGMGSAPIGNDFLGDCTSLSSINIGSVNWTRKNLGLRALINVPNVDTSTLYANTLELANTFKSKLSGAIDNWVVSIN